MSPWKTVISTACLTLFAMSSVGGDFKDMLKSAKKKLADAAQTETQTPPEPTTPADTASATPAESPKANAAPSARPIGQRPASAKAEKAPWPNIATDPAIVKQQQLAYGKECRKTKGDNPYVDCACMESHYPEARLQVISEDTRELEKRAGLACKNGLDGCEEPAANMFRWITQPATQKKYPTREGLTNPPRFFTFRTDLPHMFEAADLQFGDKCRNNEYVASHAEEQCLHQVKSGLTPLKPGTSTKAYCSCVGQKAAAQEPNGEATCANQ